MNFPSPPTWVGDGTNVAVARQGRAAAGSHGIDSGAAVYFQLAVPKNSAHPNLARLFVGFMASKEAQAILEKNDFRTSHLVEGTIMAKYLKQNRVQLQEAKDSIDFYLQGEDSGLAFKEELTKLLKQ